MDESSILNGEAITLKRVFIGEWNNDGTYSDVVKMYGATQATLNVTTVGAQRYGDGSTMLASYRRLTGGTLSISFAGDITTVAKMLGIDITTSGSTPNAVRAMRIRDAGAPYVGITGSADLENGDDNRVHFFAPKAQINSDTLPVLTWGGGQAAEFPTLTVEFVLLPDDNYIEGDADEVQTVAIGTPSAGTIVLTVGGSSTSALAYTADAAAWQAALEALSVIGTGNVTVTGTTTRTITFTGRLAGTKMPLIVATPTGWTDGTSTVARVTAGAEGHSLIGGIYEVEAGWSIALPPLFTV